MLEVLKQLRHRLAERAKTTTSDVLQLEKEAIRLRTEIDRLVLALASRGRGEGLRGSSRLVARRLGVA
jgi:hypothetical protein